MNLKQARLKSQLDAVRKNPEAEENAEGKESEEEEFAAALSLLISCAILIPLL